MEDRNEPATGKLPHQEEYPNLVRPIQPGEIRNPTGIGCNEASRMAVLSKRIDKVLNQCLTVDAEMEMTAIFPEFAEFDEKTQRKLKITLLEKAIMRQGQKAAEGDKEALDWLIDNRYGKLAEKREVSGTLGVDVVDCNKLTPEQMEAIRQAFQGKRASADADPESE